MARPTLETSAKFRLLVRKLGIPKPYVRGLLETLWDVANASGNPVIGSTAEVEAAAEWPGEDGVLFTALRDGRWIDETPDGRWQIHDYFDHAPGYVQRRATREAEREAKGETITSLRRAAARSRWSKRDADSVQANASGRHLHANGSTPAPAPALEERESTAGAADPRPSAFPPIEQLGDLWRSKCPTLRQPAKWTDSRKRAWAARCREAGWSDALPAVLDRIAVSQFCNGQNDRGWRADVDWLLRPDTATKVLEGKYDSAPARGSDWADRELERLGIAGAAR